MFLRALGALTSLQHLKLEKACYVGDSEIKWLSSLCQLQSFTLTKDSFFATSQSFQLLIDTCPLLNSLKFKSCGKMCIPESTHGSTVITHLSFKGSRIPSANFRLLLLFPELKRLKIYNIQLACLTKLLSLKVFGIYFEYPMYWLSGSCIRCLCALPLLRSLTIRLSEEIMDEDIMCLSNLSALEHLCRRGFIDQ